MDLFNDVIYPGTYSPIYDGHLDIGEQARLETGAKKVILVPAFSPYHKAMPGNATPDDRLKMTKLAAKSRKRFEVSDVEFRMKKEKSYTYETIQQLIEETIKKPFVEGMKLPNKIKLLVGTDEFEKLESGWYQIHKLVKLVDFVVAQRPKTRSVEEIAKDLKLEGLSFQRVQVFVDNSSSMVRELIKQGQDVSKLMPKKVLNYINKRRLYR